MPRSQPIQTNFTSGEISPIVKGRVDIDRYNNGASRLENFIVHPQGGITRRGGSQFVNEVKTSSKKVRLKEFIFSETQSYVLEFGDLYVRVHYQRARLGTVEVVTPYTEAQLDDLYFTQSADILYIAHPSHQPQKLQRTAHETWALSSLVTKDGPYLAIDENDIELTVTDYSLRQDVVSTFAPTITNIVWGGGTATVTTSRDHTIESGTPMAITISGVDPAGYNGSFTGTWVDDTNFTITVADGGSYVSGGTMTMAVFVTGDTALGFAGGQFEYRVGNQWVLYTVKTFTDDYSVTVEPIDRVVAPLDSDVTVDVDTVGTKLVSSASGVWSTDVTAHWIRVDYDSGGSDENWFLLDVYGPTTTDITYNTTNAGTPITNAYRDFGYTPRGMLSFSNEVISCTILASSAAFVASDATDNRQLRIFIDNQWNAFTITGFVSTTEVTGTLLYRIRRFSDNANIPNPGLELADSGKVTTWRLGAFSTATGYPAVVAFHEQRLAFGSTTVQPNTVWLSKSADFENFEPSIPDTLVVAADNAVTFTLASGQINQIEWLQSGPVLLVGTLGDEWQIKPTLLSDSLSPNNLIATPQTSYGSHSEVSPQRIDNVTIFVQRSGNKVVELTFDFDTNSFKGRDLTLVSEHILRDGSGAKQSAYQRESKSIYWSVLNDGTLTSLTYLRDQQVFAWARHILGGSFSSGQAVVESVAIIPSATDRQDEIYISVKRTVNSATVRFVEVFVPEFYPSTSQDKDLMRYVDSFVTYDSTPTTAISGLTHLEGETVTPVVDGALHPAKVVSSGAITLDYAGSIVHTGLPYTSLVETLTPEIPMSGSGDTSQTSYRRFVSFGVRLWNSMMFEYSAKDDAKIIVSTASWAAGIVTVTTTAIHALATGMNVKIVDVLPAAYNGTYEITSLNNTTFTYALAADPTSYTSGGKATGAYTNSGSNFLEWNSREENDPMDASPPIITGDRDLSIPDGYDLTKTLIVKTDAPYPLTILSLIYKMEAHAR